ncbi:MAG: hypothetical protein HYU41_14670 [Candidatus Rokubacteria bacterium]|nr:hypothetical protein [Candidatus Rokubacteria bacterium]
MSAVQMARWSRRTTVDLPAALHRSFGALDHRLRQAVARFLNRRVTTDELKVPNDMTQLYRRIRRGDVVLVEGELRVSQLVKYVTQSQWSHSALYVGDELLRRGGPLREQALANFGERADRLLVEALTDEGVIAAPLAKYRAHNLRLCRPSGLHPADLERVIDSVVVDLGKQYDARNFFELALLLLAPARLGPLKRWTARTCLGNCTELQVICSGMIAKAFQRVGYPILPERRHYSQILPRDFDLSPNFQVIKASAIDDGGVDALDAQLEGQMETVAQRQEERGERRTACWPFSCGRGMRAAGC